MPAATAARVNMRRGRRCCIRVVAPHKWRLTMSTFTRLPIRRSDGVKGSHRRWPAITGAGSPTGFIMHHICRIRHERSGFVTRLGRCWSRCRRYRSLENKGRTAAISLLCHGARRPLCVRAMRPVMGLAKSEGDDRKRRRSIPRVPHDPNIAQRVSDSGIVTRFRRAGSTTQQ